MERLKTNKTIEEIASEGTADISDIIKLANTGTAEWTDNDVLNKLWEHDQSILNIPKVGDWPPSPQPGDWPPATDKTTMYGWVCPKCGKVNAPHRDFCDCSGNVSQLNITYNTGSSGNNPNPYPTINIATDEIIRVCNIHQKKENNNEIN